jgi:hypothetical protein
LKKEGKKMEAKSIDELGNLDSDTIKKNCANPDSHVTTLISHFVTARCLICSLLDDPNHAETNFDTSSYELLETLLEKGTIPTVELDGIQFSIFKDEKSEENKRFSLSGTIDTEFFINRVMKGLTDSVELSVESCDLKVSFSLSRTDSITIQFTGKNMDHLLEDSLSRVVIKGINFMAFPHFAWSRHDIFPENTENPKVAKIFLGNFESS